MERTLAIAYLEEVRNLETLCYYLNQRYDETVKHKKEQEKRLILRELPHWSMRPVVALVICVVLLISSIIAFLWGQDYKNGLYSGIIFFFVGYVLPAFLVVIAIVVLFVVRPFSTLLDDARHRKECTHYNSQVHQQKSDIEGEIRSLDAQLVYYRQESQKVHALLAEAYDFNVIPAQFRSLAHVVYIHDYMATSESTIEDTLLHAHMEAGIRAITARLDIIINQNIRIIQLLQAQLLQVAKNTATLNIIAQNSQMTAHFSRVNSYILTADYLRG